MSWLSNMLSAKPEQSSVQWDLNALVIDVRSPSEFASGHVEGAINIPLDRFAQSYESMIPDKSRQVILYCQSGARSGQACQFLIQQNYLNVVNGRNAATVSRQLNQRAP